jgi:hypothetical protein
VSVVGRESNELMVSSELSPELSCSPTVSLADRAIEAPPLSLESNPGRLGQPSLFRHLDLHYQLCIAIAKTAAQLGSLSSTRAEVASGMRSVISNWIANLPAEYTPTNPNTRWDREYEWVVEQREYLRLVEAVARVNHTLQRENQKRVSVFGVLKDSLTRLGQARSEANKAAAQHQSLWFPVPPNFPYIRLSEVPQDIIERFETFIGSVRAESDEQGWKDLEVFM